MAEIREPFGTKRKGTFPPLETINKELVKTQQTGSSLCMPF
jgi:hypothetical protein